MSVVLWNHCHLFPCRSTTDRTLLFITAKQVLLYLIYVVKISWDLNSAKHSRAECLFRCFNEPTFLSKTPSPPSRLSESSETLVYLNHPTWHLTREDSVYCISRICCFMVSWHVIWTSEKYILNAVKSSLLKCAKSLLRKYSEIDFRISKMTILLVNNVKDLRLHSSQTRVYWNVNYGPSTERPKFIK